MSQDVTLFSGTLLDNLRFAKPDATMEEVRKSNGVVPFFDSHIFV